MNKWCITEALFANIWFAILHPVQIGIDVINIYNIDFQECKETSVFKLSSPKKSNLCLRYTAEVEIYVLISRVI